MDEKESFEKLGLDPGASEGEVEAAFRRLAKDMHPDVGGEHDEMAELLRAREIALESLGSRSLVTRAAIVELATASTRALESQQRQIERQQKQDASNRMVSRIVRHHTSRYKRYRRGAAFVGWVSVATGILTARIIPGTGGTILDMPLLAPFFLALALLAAVYYWMLYVSAENIQHAIEDTSESLEYKSTYVDLIYEIADKAYVSPPVRDRPWTREELLESVERWIGYPAKLVFPLIPQISRDPSLRRLARTIGVPEFVRLLISKGLAQDTLEEHEERSRGRISVRYSLPVASGEDEDERPVHSSE